MTRFKTPPEHQDQVDFGEFRVRQGRPMPVLNRRIPDGKVLQREIDAWQSRRNSERVRVDWRFTTADAKI